MNQAHGGRALLLWLAGWVVLRINGQSMRGRSVREVAQMFRDLAKVGKILTDGY